jgi:type I restriction enzyme S subunit
MSVIKDIPKHWQVKKLGEVADYLNGRAFKPNEWERTGKPIIRIQNLNKEAAAYNYTSKEFEDKYKIEKGDLLYAWSASLGVYIWNGDKAWLNQHIFKVVPKNNCDKKYLFYTLEKITVELYAKAHGSGMVHVTKGKFEETKIPFPLLPEQQAIVAKIEELLSNLENGKQQLQTAQQQLKVYRQSLLKWAFEGKLTEEWRKKNKNIMSAYETLKNVSISRKKNYEQRKKQKDKRVEKNYDFIFSKSNSIDSWANATLDKLIYIAGRIGWRGLTRDEYTSEGPLFLSVHSLNYGKYVEFKDAYHISEDRYLESPEIILENNDTLLCKDGAGIGKIGIINKLPQKATVNSSLLLIRGLEIFTPAFLYYLLSGPKLQSIVQSRISGSATPHLFQNDIRKFQLLVPPIEEQHQIVSELESKLTVCDKIEETINQSLQQAETLRQSILKKAFEGKLVQTEVFTSKKKELA